MLNSASPAGLRVLSEGGQASHLTQLAAYGLGKGLV
jgi:hypothetical protein